MILKDASAYNIQFHGASPIFIDLLSFEKRSEASPWIAYAQFCSHFLAPLALASTISTEFLKLSKIWIDGIPLDFASKLLPLKSRLSPGLFWHIHLHSKMRIKHAESNNVKKGIDQIKVSDRTLIGIAESLENTIKNLKRPETKTAWSDYYADTNYSAEASSQKMSILEHVASENCGERALDLGANTGIYSAILAKYFENVVSADMDSMAIEKQYLRIKNEGPHNVTPVVLDLLNPSPGIGWNCEERKSFMDRCGNMDFVTALALAHHLAITSNVPLVMIGEFLSSLLRAKGCLLIEFVPKEDSQVQRMLSNRIDIFDDYSLENMMHDFERFFSLTQKFEIGQSQRILLLYKKII
jgi:hypothetical protein